jgi:hypothetical protein
MQIKKGPSHSVDGPLVKGNHNSVLLMLYFYSCSLLTN